MGGKRVLDGEMILFGGWDGVWGSGEMGGSGVALVHTLTKACREVIGRVK